MRVLIEEEALEPYFKYVANEMNDDGCIYLLYKLKKSIEIVQSDGRDLAKESDRINKLLAKAWSNRGLYPSLGRVLDIISGVDSSDYGLNEPLISAIKDSINEAEGDDLLEKTFEIIESTKPPKNLAKFASRISDLRNSLRDYQDQVGLVKKLVLLNLSHRQIERILNDKENAFNREITVEELAENPYLLAEEYCPLEYEGKDAGKDNDQEEPPDAPIGLFTIDIGMHADSRYTPLSSNLQNLSASHEYRIRTLVVEYLYQRGEVGDCFAGLQDVYDFIVDSPIFFKSPKLNFPKSRLETMQGAFKEHLEKRIQVTATESGKFFYLKEAKFSELLVRDTVEKLLGSEIFRSLFQI